MAEDIIKVEILKDGLIRSETDKISAPNHSSGHAFFKLMEELAGAKQERVRRSKTHVHHHQYEEEKA